MLIRTTNWDVENQMNNLEKGDFQVSTYICTTLDEDIFASIYISNDLHIKLNLKILPLWSCY